MTSSAYERVQKGHPMPGLIEANALMPIATTMVLPNAIIEIS